MDLKIAIEQRDRVEDFRRRHRIGLLTLLFTDMVGSTQLKQTLGDAEAFARIQEHHAAVREILAGFPEGEEIGTAGDSFFIVFAKPSEAVKFSLLLQSRLRELSANNATPTLDRIGIHIGEVIIEERPGAAKAKDLYGIQVDVCARVMSLGDGDQILMTRATFDNARQVLKGQDLAQLGPLTWEGYGAYLLQGVEEPLEVCEVGETGRARLAPPADSAKARRAESLRDGSRRLPRSAETARRSRQWLGAAFAAGAMASVGFVIYFRPDSVPAVSPGVMLARIGFETGEGYLAGQPLDGRQGWRRDDSQNQLAAGGEGVALHLFPGSPQQAFIGGTPGAMSPGIHRSLRRKIEFTPAPGDDAELMISWRQLITDSTNGARNHFEWLFGNQSGRLLCGVSFNNKRARSCAAGRITVSWKLARHSIEAACTT